MYRPVLLTPSATTPVSLDEVKAHCRVDGTDNDTFLTSLIAAAVSHVDGWSGILGRCLIEQSWRQDYDAFARRLRLPLFPVASITSVKYDDDDGVSQTINASNYTLQADGLGAYVQFKSTYSFASVNDEAPAVHVEYVAGDADAEAVPPAIKAAMLLLIGHWYENREAVAVGTGLQMQQLPMAVDALLAPFRRIRF